MDSAPGLHYGMYEGLLEKRSRKNMYFAANWKTRKFVLNGQDLIYSCPTSNEEKGRVSTSGLLCQRLQPHEAEEHPFAFALYKDNTSQGAKEKHLELVLMMNAEDQQSRARWISYLDASIKNPRWRVEHKVVMAKSGSAIASALLSGSQMKETDGTGTEGEIGKLFVETVDYGAKRREYQRLHTEFMEKGGLGAHIRTLRKNLQGEKYSKIGKVHIDNSDFLFLTIVFAQRESATDKSGFDKSKLDEIEIDAVQDKAATKEAYTALAKYWPSYAKFVKDFFLARVCFILRVNVSNKHVRHKKVIKASVDRLQRVVRQFLERRAYERSVKKEKAIYHIAKAIRHYLARLARKRALYASTQIFAVNLIHADGLIPKSKNCVVYALTTAAVDQSDRFVNWYKNNYNKGKFETSNIQWGYGLKTKSLHTSTKEPYNTTVTWSHGDLSHEKEKTLRAKEVCYTLNTSKESFIYITLMAEEPGKSPQYLGQTVIKIDDYAKQLYDERKVVEIKAAPLVKYVAPVEDMHGRAPFPINVALQERDIQGHLTYELRLSDPMKSMKGYIEKYTNAMFTLSGATWKKRFFVLADGWLQYNHAEDELVNIDAHKCDLRTVHKIEECLKNLELRLTFYSNNSGSVEWKLRWPKHDADLSRVDLLTWKRKIYRNCKLVQDPEVLQWKSDKWKDDLRQTYDLQMERIRKLEEQEKKEKKEEDQKKHVLRMWLKDEEATFHRKDIIETRGKLSVATSIATAIAGATPNVKDCEDTKASDDEESSDNKHLNKMQRDRDEMLKFGVSTKSKVLKQHRV